MMEHNHAAEWMGEVRRGKALGELVAAAKIIDAEGSKRAAVLQAEGIPTAVVSMPCWELFEAQDAGYRSAVLGEGCVRVGVEAAMRFGWDAWLGPRGGFVGMAGFGASGPYEQLYAHFGITPANIVAEAKRYL